MSMWTADRGYFYGVILGDGCIYKNPKTGTKAITLKAIDEAFVNKWADVVERLWGFRYAVTKFDPNEKGRQRSPMFRCRSGKPEMYDEVLEVTRGKTIVPNGVLMGDRSVKIAFLQGLMDSEGWIAIHLASLGRSYLTIGFAVTAPWADDVHRLFKEMGVRVSDLKVRQPRPSKLGTERKPLRDFTIDIQDYVRAGLGFVAERKANRLALATRILNDFTSSYQRYASHASRFKRTDAGPVDDKV